MSVRPWLAYSFYRCFQICTLLKTKSKAFKRLKAFYPPAKNKETNLVHSVLVHRKKPRCEEMLLPAQDHRVSNSRFCFHFARKYFGFQVISPVGIFPFFKRMLLEPAVLGTKEWIESTPASTGAAFHDHKTQDEPLMKRGERCLE